MDISRLNDWLQVSTVVFTLLAAGCGFGAYFTGKTFQATLKGKIENLEKRQTGRTIAPDQIYYLVTGLKKIQKPTLPIYIMGIQGNPESIQFANSIKKIFEMAGFAVDGVWEDVIIGGTGPGLLIRQEILDAPTGLSIMELFKNSAIEARIIAIKGLKPERVEIIVGYKP